MSPMIDLRTVAVEFRSECSEDYVGLWQIAKALGTEPDFLKRMDALVEVVHTILEEEDIAIGQFVDGDFTEWPGDRHQSAERVRLELRRLGRDPDIGEVAWLVKRTGATQ